MDQEYDVVVVGGGPAGLSGALALARSLRSVLVVDAGRPRNQRAAHLHNYLGFDHRSPAELLAAGRADLAAYGVGVHSGWVTAATPRDGGFDVTVAGDGAGPDAEAEADTTTVRARRLLLATGVVDQLPDVPGLAERWGRDVLHCPYCHGYEVRGQTIGVLATGPAYLHVAPLFRQLSPSVTVFLHAAVAPTDDQRAELGARGIRIVEGTVVGLEVSDDRLTGVRLTGGDVVPLDALVVAPRAHAGGPLLDSLGLQPEPLEVMGQPVGTVVPADPTGLTAVPGVWAAGNLVNPNAQLIASAAAGLMAGAMINADLVAADTRAAVDAHRRVHGDGPTVFDADLWEQRYTERTAVWSGRVNAVLAGEAAELSPGRALDAGCGEGADALWLAERGWTVTGVDFAGAALRRGARAAEAAGVADRVRWEQTDLTGWTPEAAAYDLVTAHFLHLPLDVLLPLFDRLAAAVAPGGCLLLVGHHPSDRDAGVPRPDLPVFFTAEQIAERLDPGRWTVERAEARPRSAVAPDGRAVTIHDTVLRAVRIG